MTNNTEEAEQSHYDTTYDSNYDTTYDSNNYNENDNENDNDNYNDSFDDYDTTLDYDNSGTIAVPPTTTTTTPLTQRNVYEPTSSKETVETLEPPMKPIKNPAYKNKKTFANFTNRNKTNTDDYSYSTFHATQDETVQEEPVYAVVNKDYSSQLMTSGGNYENNYGVYETSQSFSQVNHDNNDQDSGIYQQTQDEQTYDEPLQSTFSIEGWNTVKALETTKMWFEHPINYGKKKKACYHYSVSFVYSLLFSLSLTLSLSPFVLTFVFLI